MRTVTLKIDVESADYVELTRAFARRGPSQLKTRVAKLLRRIDKSRGVVTSPQDWYHIANKGALYHD